MALSVNGDYFDWGSITVDVDGVKYDNEWESISYKESSKFTVLPGRGKRPKGRTRGKLEYDGEVKLSREAFADLVRQLGGSNWRNKQVNLTVSYSLDDDTSNSQVDKLLKVKFHSPDNSHENKEDGLMVTLTLSIMDIVYDGEDENTRQ